MNNSNHVPDRFISRRTLRRTACSVVLVWVGLGARAQTPPDTQAAMQTSGSLALTPRADTSALAAGSTRSAQISSPTASKQESRAAENAYLAGAKRLQRDDASGAEREFIRAHHLDPGNHQYAVAIEVARQHRLTELVHQASQAKLAGDPARAQTLLAEARAIDPEDPIVLEHSGPAFARVASAGEARNPASRSLPASPSSQSTTPLTDRAQLLAVREGNEPWKNQVLALAGPVQIHPAETPQSFHLRGDAQDLLRQVAAAYGIRAVFDASVEHTALRFDLEDQRYQQAMPLLMSMTHVLAVPIDETSVLIARDTAENRQRLQRQLEEMISVPGFSTEQINDLGNVIRNLFQGAKATVQPSQQSILVMAPEEIVGPMNRTLADLIDGSGEVMIEVALYEIDTTHTRNVGATIPQQFSVFSVDAAANSLVNANQSLVQQAIAQGYISSSASNLQIALALIASGLVQSSLATNLLGVFGGGLFQTGISGSASATLNLGLNATDSRALDDVQIRVSDRQPATFRAGSKYPVTTSTYTTGLSTAASTLSNATINGVSVASLLSQYAGGTSTTIPQVSYEDLGVTLKATPTIQQSGRIFLQLDMKLEALGGSSLNGIPLLMSRQFTSEITLGDGETAMLASNVNRTESAAVTGLPGLSELPGFEAPVDKDAEKDTGQLIVLVTPHVLRRRANMVAGPRILIRSVEPPAAN
jgi:Flp pilus assembly secretin CpaC